MAPRSGFPSRPSLQSKTLRQRAGLTQGQLAEWLGVTCHAIQTLEKGQRAVRKGWDFKLAEALGFSVSDPARGRERCSQQKVAASMDQFDSESALHAAIGRRGHRELPPFGAMRHLGVRVVSRRLAATSPVNEEWRSPMKHKCFGRRRSQ